jgi:hypothetical protein
MASMRGPVGLRYRQTAWSARRQRPASKGVPETSARCNMQVDVLTQGVLSTSAQSDVSMSPSGGKATRLRALGRPKSPAAVAARDHDFPRRRAGLSNPVTPSRQATAASGNERCDVRHVAVSQFHKSLVSRGGVTLPASSRTTSFHRPTVDRPSIARLLALVAAIILVPRRRAASPAGS